jgi:hypothetical protein
MENILEQAFYGILWFVGAIIFLWLICLPSLKRREREGAEQYLRLQQEEQEDLDRYNKKQEEEFVSAVISFEEDVPDKFRSIWYFLKWSVTDYEEGLYCLYFDEWLEGRKIYDFYGQFYEKKEEYTFADFDEMDKFRSTLIDRLPYPKYVKKDMYTATIIANSEELLLANFADMVGFFDGEYEKNNFLWELNAERESEDQKRKSKEESIRDKLGLK